MTIPKALRDRHGERYRIVSLESGIKLIPIPEDPIEALREAAGSDLRAASLDELQRAAEAEARTQSEGHVR